MFYILCEAVCALIFICGATSRAETWGQSGTDPSMSSSARLLTHSSKGKKYILFSQINCPAIFQKSCCAAPWHASCPLFLFLFFLKIYFHACSFVCERLPGVSLPASHVCSALGLPPVLRSIVIALCRMKSSSKNNSVKWFSAVSRQCVWPTLIQLQL